MFDYHDHLTLDLNKLHPTMRDSFAREIDYLNRTWPLRAGFKVAVRVSDTYCPQGANCSDLSEFKPMQGSGLTSKDGENRQFSITLKESMFGVSADLKMVKMMQEMDLKMQFHGSMKDNTFVLTHEYGHCLDGVMTWEFLADDADHRDQGLRDDYFAFMELGANAVERTIKSATFEQKLLMSVAQTMFPNKNDPNRMVSGYAMVGGPAEYFAETFAAICWADEEDRQLPSVKALEKVLQHSYRLYDQYHL